MFALYYSHNTLSRPDFSHLFQECLSDRDSGPCHEPAPLEGLVHLVRQLNLVDSIRVYLITCSQFIWNLILWAPYMDKEGMVYNDHGFLGPCWLLSARVYLGVHYPE